jgi:hypothetical protein
MNSLTEGTAILAHLDKRVFNVMRITGGAWFL